MSKSFRNTVGKSFNLFVVLSVFLSLSLSPLSFGGSTTVASTTAPVSAPSLKSESQIKSEATLYDTAIREISRLTNINLTTVDNLKVARATLEKNVPNLRFNRSKLISIAMNDSTFIGAARAKSNDPKIAREFMEAVCKDTKTIMTLPGAESVGLRMSSSFDADNLMLQKVAEQLRRASAELKKASAHHAVNANLSPLPLPRISATLIETLVVAAAVVVVPGLSLVLFDLAINGAIIASAALLIGRLVVNLGTDKGRDAVAACEDAAAATYHDCAGKAADLGPLFGAPALALCLTQWVAQSAACLLIDTD